MSVLTVSLSSGFFFGMVTFGMVPKAPAAVTALPVVPADDDEAAGLAEPPQAARTRQAITGMAMSARRRRMETLNSRGCQPRQPTGTAGRSASMRLHAGDQFLDALVDRTEGVLAQDSALSLVVQLQVDPVDGE